MVARNELQIQAYFIGTGHFPGRAARCCVWQVSVGKWQLGHPPLPPLNGYRHFICRLPILTRRPAKSGPEERDKCV